MSRIIIQETAYDRNRVFMLIPVNHWFNPHGIVVKVLFHQKDYLDGSIE